MSSADLIRRSQIFIAFCAVAMGAETYLITGQEMEPVVLAVIFFASLFIYNASRLSISFHRIHDSGKYTFQADGNPLSIIFCCISLVALFALLTACTWQQLLVFITASILSLAYMMPFKRHGRQLEGLRRNLFLKNIILSLTWATSTVLLPIVLYNFQPITGEVVFMFARRFFFIYSLAVIYDLRDVEADTRVGMETIAVKFGEKLTQQLSLVSLLLFVIFTVTDPFLAHPEMRPHAIALLLSAFGAALVILNTHYILNKSYYSLVVDAAMVLQFLLVLLSGHI